MNVRQALACHKSVGENRQEGKLKFAVQFSLSSEEAAKLGGATPGAAWRVVEQQCYKLALRESHLQPRGYRFGFRGAPRLIAEERFIKEKSMSWVNLNYKTATTLLTGLLILLSVNAAALGQGGTGREPTPPKKTAPKKTSTKSSPKPANPIAEIDRKLAELKRKRGVLLAQLTPESPQVKELDKQITLLEKQREDILRKTAGPGSSPTNPSSANNPTVSAPPANPTAGTIVRNKIGMELVWIPAGTFMMGSENGNADEKPVHSVTLVVTESSRPAAAQAESDLRTFERELKRAQQLFESNALSRTEYDAAQTRYNNAKAKLDAVRTIEGFYMGRYEVTQAQWQAVMGNNPSFNKDCGGNCPVETVSWVDAKDFIQRLNGMNDGYTYRLPTEAEWEYACRAGTTGDYAGDLKEMAWSSENSGNGLHAVGQKQPNAWGLADMHGNVWEWCEDWYHETYNGAPTDGSAWLSGGGSYKVIRGGSWNDPATFLRSSDRRFKNAMTPVTHLSGFRVVAIARPQ